MKTLTSKDGKIGGRREVGPPPPRVSSGHAPEMPLMAQLVAVTDR